LFIRDLRRRVVLISTPEEWYLTALPAGLQPPLPGDGPIEEMWGSYFEAIANPARKNRLLQRKFVPIRYRSHMTEFKDDMRQAPS
jgi:hypothetical protein